MSPEDKSYLELMQQSNHHERDMDIDIGIDINQSQFQNPPEPQAQDQLNGRDQANANAQQQAQAQKQSKDEADAQQQAQAQAKAQTQAKNEPKPQEPTKDQDDIKTQEQPKETVRALVNTDNFKGTLTLDQKQAIEKQDKMISAIQESIDSSYFVQKIMSENSDGNKDNLKSELKKAKDALSPINLGAIIPDDRYHASLMTVVDTYIGRTVNDENKQKPIDGSACTYKQFAHDAITDMAVASTEIVSKELYSNEHQPYHAMITDGYAFEKNPSLTGDEKDILKSVYEALPPQVVALVDRRMYNAQKQYPANTFKFGDAYLLAMHETVQHDRLASAIHPDNTSKPPSEKRPIVDNGSKIQNALLEAVYGKDAIVDIPLYEYQTDETYKSNQLKRRRELTEMARNPNQPKLTASTESPVKGNSQELIVLQDALKGSDYFAGKPYLKGINDKLGVLNQNLDNIGAPEHMKVAILNHDMSQNAHSAFMSEFNEQKKSEGGNDFATAIKEHSSKVQEVSKAQYLSSTHAEPHTIPDNSPISQLLADKKESKLLVSASRNMSHGARNHMYDHLRMTFKTELDGKSKVGVDAVLKEAIVALKDFDDLYEAVSPNKPEASKTSLRGFEDTLKRNFKTFDPKNPDALKSLDTIKKGIEDGLTEAGKVSKDIRHKEWPKPTNIQSDGSTKQDLTADTDEKTSDNKSDNPSKPNKKSADKKKPEDDEVDPEDDVEYDEDGNPIPKTQTLQRRGGQNNAPRGGGQAQGPLQAEKKPWISLSLFNKTNDNSSNVAENSTRNKTKSNSIPKASDSQQKPDRQGFDFGDPFMNDRFDKIKSDFDKFKEGYEKGTKKDNELYYNALNMLTDINLLGSAMESDVKSNSNHKDRLEVLSKGLKELEPIQKGLADIADKKGFLNDSHPLSKLRKSAGKGGTLKEEIEKSNNFMSNLSGKISSFFKSITNSVKPSPSP